ncbi:hypothetical protein NX059_003204 [Plenodomus lindquistii]|nr:hypothetical protein NX059_003204 [Plenodomus lindquistii]
MRPRTVLCTLLQGSLVHVLATTDGSAEGIRLAFDHGGFVPNTTTPEEDATNCTITHTKHTETMTCVFNKPTTDMVHCIRTQRRTTEWPPLRVRIADVHNITYVPESSESMLNIFIARDLYRNHKVLSRRKYPADFLSHDEQIKRDRDEEDVLDTKKARSVKIAFGIMLTVIAAFTCLVAVFNTRTIFKMGVSEKEDFLDAAVQRSDLIERLREVVRLKRKLLAELEKFKVEEDDDGDDDVTLSPRRLSTSGK